MVGVRLWLFGIFSSGPRADDMVNGFREIDARFPTQELLISHRTRKAHNQSLVDTIVTFLSPSGGGSGIVHEIH
jgi:hypothetical protein